MNERDSAPEILFGSAAASAVLRAAYDAARGRYLRPVTYEQIAARLPVSRHAFHQLARGLEASGYSRRTGDGVEIALEHAGLDWVEQTLSSEPPGSMCEA